MGVRCAIEWRQANADYVRTTKDVDVCMRRVDLERAAIALKPHGFELTEVKGIPMFFDGSDATPKQAVHIVLAEDPVPDIGEGVRDETFHWKRVELDRLLTMKMIANRAHDHVHVMDLYRSGAIARASIAFKHTCGCLSKMCLIDAIASTAILRIERGVTTFGLVAPSTQPRGWPRSDWVLVVTRSHHLVRHVHPNLMRAVGVHMIMCLSGAAHRYERNFHKNLLFRLLELISESVLRKLLR